MMASHDSFVIDIPDEATEVFSSPRPPTQARPLLISTPHDVTKPHVPLFDVSTLNPECNKQSYFQSLSPTTCLELVPLLTSEQVRREFTYLTSLNPNSIKCVKFKNPRRPTLVEQRAVIRKSLTQETVVVHDMLQDNAAVVNNTLIPSISCMLTKLELQSRDLDFQAKSLAKSLDELNDLKYVAECPVSNTPLFATSCTTTSTNACDTDSHTSDSRSSDSRPTNTRSPADNTQKVLFLTDSILNCFKPEKFKPRDSNSKMNITKFNLFKLQELDTNGFDKFDTIIISSGINDLSKYKYSPDSLFERVSQPLASVNPNTKVIFRALTPTRFEYINKLVYRFNNLMFDFCLTHSHLYYYDPHNFEKRSDFLYNQGNGIHVSYHVAVFMTMHILNHAQFLYTRSGEFERWPLRASLQDRYERHVD